MILLWPANSREFSSRKDPERQFQNTEFKVESDDSKHLSFEHLCSYDASVFRNTGKILGLPPSPLTITYISLRRRQRLTTTSVSSVYVHTSGRQRV